MIALAAGNPSAWTGPTGNNTYLLPGAVPALIDAGVGNPAHLDAIAGALNGRPLALVLITHGHPDHIAGADALAARWPGLRLRNGGGHLVHAPFADGELIPAGDAVLRAIHTPGHSPDHFCFVDERAGDLFCGDLAREGGTIVIPASRGGDLAQYLASLRRVRALAPRRLLPGHGPIVNDPLALIDSYLQHRTEREAQIVDALQAGCRSPEQIVARVYGPLARPLQNAAADSVLAHLIKLEGEGMVNRAGEVWRLTR